MSTVASALAKNQLHYNEGVSLTKIVIMFLSRCLSDSTVSALALMTWDVLVHIDEEVRSNELWNWTPCC